MVYQKMMLRYSLILLLTLGFLTNCSEKSEGKILQVAVSADMQFAMDSIAVLFEKKHHISCEIISNSSGILAAQIEQGAPFDLFLSANLVFIDKLQAKGFSNKPHHFASGKLMFVYAKDQQFNSIEQALRSTSIKRFAQADSIGAPYGVASNQYLTSTNQLQPNKNKLIYGESIEQVNQYLISKSVDAVFTSNSFLTRYGQDYHFIEVAPAHYSPIKQGVVVLKHGKINHPEESNLLLEFFKSDECKSVLKYYGYIVN